MNIQQAKILRKKVRAALRMKGYSISEGSCSPEEMVFLANTIALTDIRLIAEIGFNAGYSSHAMLSERGDITVVSFDICRHNYCKTAKDLIDEMYRNKHKLVVGDSTVTVPKFATEHPQIKFDFGFIDGGHSHKVASADIQNMKHLLRKDAMVVMDDVTPFRTYGQGPHKAWIEAQEAGLVEHLSFHQDGEIVDSPTPSGTHVWATGVYK